MTNFSARRKKAGRLALASVLAAVGSQAVHAQTVQPAAEEPAAENDDGEIIVTAQKRNERLRDVPISITAASGEQLQRLGIRSPDDLTRAVPGLTFKPSRTGIPIQTLRGIGFDDFGIGSAPAVSVSVDQVPLPFLIMTPAASLDIERVEVLKGPQGTLFGQNTTGGAINFIAAKPTTDMHMGFDLTYGRFNQVDASGFVSGPISDTLRFRLAAKHEYRGDWQISESRPDDTLGKRNFSAGRLLLDWTPSETLSIELNANGWIDKSDTQAAQFVLYSPTVPPGIPFLNAIFATRSPTPDSARLAEWTAGNRLRRDNWQFQLSARADWQASDSVTVTSITAYTKLKTDTPTETSASNLGLFLIDQRGRIETFTQELRAAVDADAFKLTVGANYEYARTDDVFDIPQFISSNGGLPVVPGNPSAGVLTWNAFTETAFQRTKTYAAFASVDVPLSPTLTAQAGVRYTKQDRNFLGCLQDEGDGDLANAIALIPTYAGLPYAPAAVGTCVTLSSTLQTLPNVTSTLNEDNISWRAGMNWKPIDGALVYANVTRGFKAGGYSPVPAVFAAQYDPVVQEKVTGYELGLKSTMLDRLLDVNAAVFYNDYVNKQLLAAKNFAPFGALPVLQNIPKSRVWGAELEMTLRPVHGLTLAGGVTYVNSRVLKGDPNSVVTDPLGNPDPDLAGEPFPNAPRWQANGNFNYEFPISASLEASFGGDISYRSSAISDFGRNPLFVYDSYALVGLRAGIGSPDGRWNVDVWGKNITNKFYVNGIFKTTDVVGRTTGMPATYGVTLRTRF